MTDKSKDFVCCRNIGKQTESVNLPIPWSKIRRNTDGKKVKQIGFIEFVLASSMEFNRLRVGRDCLKRRVRKAKWSSKNALAGKADLADGAEAAKEQITKKVSLTWHPVARYCNRTANCHRQNNRINKLKPLWSFFFFSFYMQKLPKKP